MLYSTLLNYAFQVYVSGRTEPHSKKKTPTSRHQKRAVLPGGPFSIFRNVPMPFFYRTRITWPGYRREPLMPLSLRSLLVLVPNRRAMSQRESPLRTR
jgi:hypothetical protein